jgi:hypothetical protein
VTTCIVTGRSHSKQATDFLASFPSKINTFRKRVKNGVIDKGIQVGIECK